jgi:hypothetical protein
LNIINSEVLKKETRENIQALNIEGKKITNPKTIAEIFNKYFSDIAINNTNDKFKATNYMT